MTKTSRVEKDGPVADESLAEQIIQRNVHVQLQIEKGRGSKKVTSVEFFPSFVFSQRHTISGTCVM